MSTSKNTTNKVKVSASVARAAHNLAAELSAASAKLAISEKELKNKKELEEEKIVTEEKEEVQAQLPVPEELLIEDLDLYDAVYKTTLLPAYKNRKPYAKADPNAIVAFMPGTVRSIFVKKGDFVKMGQKLMVLEAMKMNNEMLSPVDGVIKNIPVKSDMSVGRQTLLMEIKPMSKDQAKKLADKEKAKKR